LVQNFLNSPATRRDNATVAIIDRRWHDEGDNPR